MNADDQLGFVIVLSETSAIGVTIESGQFIHVTYDKKGKAQSTALSVKGESGTEVVGSFRQVSSTASRRQNELFLVALSDTFVNVYQATLGQKVEITVLKRLRQACDCICAVSDEPSFFLAERNAVQKALIDPNPGPKCLVSKVKHVFSKSD